MRRKAIFLALLALVFEAQARSVSSDEAVCAARAWAKTGLDRAPTVRATASRRQTAAGAAFYAVPFDGGTLFLSGDTRRRPIIAFAASADEGTTVDERSPLWALLSRDQDAQVVAEAAKSAGGATGGTTATMAATAAEREWAALLAGEEPADVVSPAKVIAPATTHVVSPTDVRVAALVKSKWGQATARGTNKDCYNACTPKLGNGQRAVCGCVATAMAQVMRHHRFPTAEVRALSRTCYVEPSSKPQAAATVSLTMQGGTYDWANMPLDPTAGVSDAQCLAIGKLTSDAGISVYMAYDVDGSGAFLFNVAKALREVFGYAGACYYRADEVSKQTQVMRDAVLSNLDAGYPVLMGISGSSGGHAIVGDGYGYGNDRLYVHLNMGWNGQDNVWYNLPDIDSSPRFTTFDDLVYDIFPRAGGAATLSGRVVDDEGRGLEDSLVEIYPVDSDVPVASDRTTNGVYGVRVAAGKYDVVAYSADGTMTEIQKAVSVSGPTESTGSYSGWINRDAGWSAEYKEIRTATTVGNLQKTTPIVIFKPTVRIGESQFASLSKALTAARALAASQPGTPVDVEVIADTELTESFVVDFACSLHSSVPAKTVTRAKDARLEVAAGAGLSVADMAFAGSSATLLAVAADGRLTVGAGVSFGVPEMTAAVETAQADGFVITGLPAQPFMVDCTSATGIDDVFGFADCDFATAQVLAAKFVNLHDPNGELAGEAEEGAGAPYALKWKLLPVSPEEATAYYVMTGKPSVTNCFRRLDRLFEIFANETGAAQVTVVKNGTLSRKVTLKGDLEIVAAGAIVSNVAATAGFVVGSGTKLTVDGLSFDGSAADALFLVDGGELRLAGDMAIRNVNGGNALYSGAVAVLAGKAEIGSVNHAVAFENCKNGHQSACGGAVYLAGDGCELILHDHVSVTGCSVRKNGGGIYAGLGAKTSLSGYLTVSGNMSGSSPKTDNLYYARASDAQNTLTLAGPVEAGSDIGLTFGSSAARTLSRPGGVFMAVGSAVVGPQLVASCEAFACDTDAGLMAVPDETGSALRWFQENGSVKPVDDQPELAVARVKDAAGAHLYRSLADAVAVAKSPATIELVSDVSLSSNLVVTGQLTLKSGDGGPFAITRTAPCFISVCREADLVVEGLTLSGRQDAENGGDGLLFAVENGALTLGANAVVCNVSGGEQRASGAVSVYRGKFTMLTGSALRDCVNPFVGSGSGNGRGGAITADSLSTVRLLGGKIESCAANRGGAAYVGNESTVEIGGNFTACDNGSVGGTANNVCVADKSQLVLVAKLTGLVGFTPGPSRRADDPVFGKVSPDFANDADIANSAHNFRHDVTDDVGVAVRNGDETLLVWSDGLNAAGNYVTAEGTVYTPVAGGDVVVTHVPAVISGLVYNGYEQVGVNAGHGFVIAGDVATNAGNYTATLTLKPGFTWEDGPSGGRQVSWSIGRATLTVTAESSSKLEGEEDPPLVYAVAGLQGKDEAEFVLTGEIVRESGEEPGDYAIGQGSLAVVGQNYVIDFVGATFTIIGSVPPPEPVPCKPFSFTAIFSPAEGQWALTINPAVKYCKYTVLASDDLKTWTPVIVDEKATVDGDMVFTLPATGPRKFWQAVGKNGEKPAAGN